MIKINPKKVLKILLIVVAFLAFANIVTLFSMYIFDSDNLLVRMLKQLFLVDMEQNVPTWYSSTTLFICSVLLAIIAIINKKKGDQYWLHWNMLSFIFLYLSMDEGSEIHELSYKLVQIAGINADGIFHYSWVIIGIPLVFILAIAYVKFLIDLPRNIRFLFVLSGSLFVGGALGMELIDGWYASINGTQSLTYCMLTTLEETLEMLGIAVFIYSLLIYISSHFKEVVISVSEE